ncbi:MAG TPA: hypothetical protein VJU78_12575 [Chitinophagaceae bacterium]|nr:hypothetical protein [Chitinophagaceae bacterium]
MNERTDTVLILTSFAEQMIAQPVLGTGGWISPEDREALDWMTLIALMGWKVKLADPQSLHSIDIDNEQIKWLILTGDPDAIRSKTWEQILFIIQTKKIVLITRAGKKDGWLFNRFDIQLSENKVYDHRIEYHGQGSSKQWKLRKSIQLRGLEINNRLDKLVTIQGTCITASVKESAGKILFLGFHPSMARDAQPVFTALLKQLLIFESLYPVAWFDWENTLILRMDDPGSAQAVHDNSFHTTKLGEGEWSIIGEELYKRNARMSLAYVPAWVDDGDSSRGELEVAGQMVSRLPGNIYPSPLVKYNKAAGNGSRQVFDYTAEFRAIQKLRDRGLVEVELHGYTHMHPDRNSWEKATDKYDNKKWFREFDRSSIGFINSLSKEEHPLLLGIEAFRKNFHSLPSTLIFPGEAFTNSALEIAMKTVLNLVSSYYLGIRIGHQLCWNQYVCSPYLDVADSHWFEHELPVVGYFHDFDVSKHGINWFAQQLEAWQQAGAQFFIDFRELSTVISHTLSIHEKAGQYQLNLHSENNPSFIKPLRIGVHIPAKNFTSKFLFNNNQKTRAINLSELEAIS